MTTGKLSVRLLCTTAMFMALCAAAGFWGIPVMTAHIYLTDLVVCMAALLLPPPWAAAACGVGAFLGDLLFYPQAMIVTLIVRTLQGLVISLMSRHAFRSRPGTAVVAAVVPGAAIMAAGYTLGHIVMYGAAETAFITYTVPQIVQAVFGAALAVLLYRRFHLDKYMK